MREKSSMNKLQHKRIDDENRFLGTLGQGSVQLNRSSFSACLSLIHCILVRELKSEESLLMYDILLMGYLLLLMWKPCIIPNQLIAIDERPTYNMYLYVTCEYGCCVCAIFNPQKYYIICIEHTRFPSLLVSLSSFGCHCDLTHSEHTKKKERIIFLIFLLFVFRMRFVLCASFTWFRMHAKCKQWKQNKLWNCNDTANTTMWHMLLHCIWDFHYSRLYPFRSGLYVSSSVSIVAWANIFIGLGGPSYCRWLSQQKTSNWMAYANEWNDTQQHEKYTIQFLSFISNIPSVSYLYCAFITNQFTTNNISAVICRSRKKKNIFCILWIWMCANWYMRAINIGQRTEYNAITCHIEWAYTQTHENCSH